jgi:hypothetical protein
MRAHEIYVTQRRCERFFLEIMVEDEIYVTQGECERFSLKIMVKDKIYVTQGECERFSFEIVGEDEIFDVSRNGKFDVVKIFNTMKDFWDDFCQSYLV